jgi:glycosyltransferase involved in cell wall biosynthesis
MKRSGVCTIVAKNYLPYARVLMASVQKWVPEAVRIVILVDHVDGYFDPAGEPFEIILSEDLDLPESRWFHFKYSILELSTAVKPYALDAIFERYGLERLIYLDPDIKVYGCLDSVFAELERCSILLTPHLTEPMEDDGCRPSELDILRAGAYNLGFIALASSDETLRFLKWWQTKVYDHCVVDLPRGLFVDQRWVDLVPGLFQGVAVIREPGFDVAYWNIKQRQIVRTPGGYQVNGRPLCFFHFSGLDPGDPDQLSRHQNRVRLAGLGDARELVLEYRDELLAQGYSRCKTWPYAFGSFENGLSVPDMGRPLHHEAPEVMSRIENPFSEEGFRAFLEVWNQPIGTANGEPAGVTRLAYRIYRTRADVQAVMPDILGGDLIRFMEWVLSSGPTEHSLHDVFLAPISNALQAAQRRKEADAKPGDGENSQPDDRGLPPQVRQALEELQSNGTLTAPEAESSDRAKLRGTAGGGKARLRLSRLARALYESRPDLQRYFPDPCGRDAARFLIWFLTYGKREYRLDEALLAPLRQQWHAVVDSLDSLPASVWHRGVFHATDLAVRLRQSTVYWRKRARSLSHVFHRRLGRRQPTTSDGNRASPSPGITAPAAGLAEGRIDFGVNLVGYLRSEMGVGESSRYAALAIGKAGIPVRLRSIDSRGPYRTTDGRAGAESETFPHSFNLFYVNADQAQIVMERLGRDFTRDKYNIGFWTWELEDFPDRWRSSFDCYREIWTPSAFCQEAIARKSPIPVVRIPYAVEVDEPPLLDRSYFGIPLKPFTFLTAFDMLSVFERKNPLAVVEAFADAFGDAADAHLVIKINHGDQRPSNLALLRDAAAGRPVTIVDRAMSRGEVNALMLACDCFVSLHRSEGFGLGIAEAMHLGKPVIVTAYSGNMDFTKPDNAFLVGYRLCPVGPGCDPYDPDRSWADPCIAEASAAMKLVRENSDLRDRRALAGRQFVRRNLSPEAVGCLMRERLELISAHLSQEKTRTASSAKDAVVRR